MKFLMISVLMENLKLKIVKFQNAYLAGQRSQFLKKSTE